jgi:hypothetical protein
VKSYRDPKSFSRREPYFLRNQGADIVRACEQSVGSSLYTRLLRAGIILIGTLSVIGVVLAANGTDDQGTASGDAVAGKLLFSDDFSSSKSGWGWLTEGDFLAAYKSGSYILTVVPADYWDYYSNSRLNLSDFIVEVEATKKGGPDDNVFGLAVRRTGPGDYYAFLISSDGYYDMEEHNDDTWVTSENWTKSEAIKTGSQTNLIRVVAQGDKFSFYANGEKLGDFVDDTLSSGSIGLFAGSQTEGNVTIAFDNFKVWSLKE